MSIRCAGLAGLSVLSLCAQQAPVTPDHAWHAPPDVGLKTEFGALRNAPAALVPQHAYTLSELVDIAERNNPETRVSWERAKERAAATGIARAALFPVIAAMASASVNQYSLFFGKFYHEDTTLFPALLNLTYTVFDFGARGAKIDEAKANLLAADFAFNDTHRKVVYEVAEAWYRLLDAVSQEEAAQATLTDAQTVQQAVEARLANGLATRPDVLEARAASAQAQYELASIRGLEAIARGSLATVLGVPAATPFQIENARLSTDAKAPEESVETIIERALAQRPDLLAQLALIRSADAQISEARSAYYPVVNFSGDWGHTNAFGEEKNFGSSAESRIFPYDAKITVSWNLFDGGARRQETARAEAARREAMAQAAYSRDQIENEIWASYTNLKTAEQQQEAAQALLDAAQESYASAMEAFQAGVRTFIDVTTAQRDLARARTAQATARVRVLSGTADLAFRAADPIPAAGR